MSAAHPLHSLPLSPSSPPESGLKRQKRRLSDDNLPDSPNSPPLMPVTANGYVSNYVDARQGMSDPSQVGSADMQRQQSATALPTPANSVTGSMKAGEAEDVDQHRDKRQRLGTEEREAGDHVIPRLSTQPTNHERQAGGSLGDAKKAKVDVDLGLFLPKTRHPRVTRLQPDPNEHLMSTYGLNHILKDVARTDPATGAKINPMRKSYENQVKSFELAGLNKPVKKELAPPFNHGRLMSKYRDPPQKEGFDISDGMRGKLQKAMQFQPGDVKNAPLWSKLLGHDQPKVEPVQPAQPIQPAAQLRANGPGRPPATKSQLQHEPIRPRRQGKRRRYDDNSFEGYADGYVDEDMSDEDDERGSARKKTRRPEYDEY